MDSIGNAGSATVASADAEPQILPSGDIAAIQSHLAIATYRWDATTDRLHWSANAGAVLDVADADLPTTGRAFHRLLTIEGAAARSNALPPIGVAVGDDYRTADYRVAYDLRGSGRVARHVEEFGRWVAGPTGCADSSEGCIIARTFDAAGRPPPNAATNPSTGLLLRDSLLARLDAEIRDLTADRHGASAFLVIAIDGLARINASFGYEVGDRIIATVARRIARRMRQGDALGHMSGHKFGAILRNCSESAVSYAAERFREAISGELIVTMEAEVEAEISIGAVILPRHAGDAEAAAMRAEEALAIAREAGDVGYAIFHPSPERDLQRRRNLRAAEDIVRGLSEGRFVLAYQPVVSAVSREIVSYEALARLVRPDGTVLSAGPLIETAERLGLVRRIDLRILKIALEDLAANPDLRLSVNASVDTMTDPVWLGALVDAISASRSIASRLTIEITETAAMRNAAEMIRLAEILRDLGCRIAIDDFGSGHTSFKALKAMEVDWVKIDGSFVRDIAENPDSAMFVKTLATLASHFGIRTVAEWVQDETAATLLADLGIDALQGRHVGEPKLRVTPSTANALAAVRVLAPEVAEDGYRSFGEILSGRIATEATLNREAVTSPAPADRAGAAWPRAAS